MISRRGFFGLLGVGAAAAAVPRPVARRLFRWRRRRPVACSMVSFDEMMKRLYPESQVLAYAEMPSSPLKLLAEAARRSDGALVYEVVN